MSAPGFPRALVPLLASLTLIIACATPATTLPSPSQGSGTTRGGTLVLDLYESPKNLNPNVIYDETSLRVATAGVFDKLVEVSSPYTKDSTLLPDLAKSWDVSPDAKVFTFKLQAGVVWHDGQPFSSADVKYTLDEIVRQKGASYGYLADIASVETPDNSTVKVTLNQPDASFMTSLGMYYGPYILPAHLYKGTDWSTNPYNAKPVGTGPFKFVEWAKDSHISFDANQGYFQGTPGVDRLVLRIVPDLSVSMAGLERGETNYLYNYPPLTQVLKWQQNPNLGVDATVVVPPVTIWMAFNVSRKPFNDVRVRQAIGTAINRAELNQKVYAGLGRPADTIQPSTSLFVDDSVKQPAFDAKKAEQLLDEAGLKRGADGVRLRATVTTTNVQQTFDLATVFKSHLHDVGIEINVNKLDWPTFQEKTINKRDYEMAISGGFRGPDPQESFKYWGSSGYRNQMNYSSARVDELYALGKSSSDKASRQKYYSELQRILAADLAALMLVEFPFAMASSHGFAGWFWEPDAKVGFFQFRKVHPLR